MIYETVVCDICGREERLGRRGERGEQVMPRRWMRHAGRRGTRHYCPEHLGYVFTYAAFSTPAASPYAAPSLDLERVARARKEGRTWEQIAAVLENLAGPVFVVEIIHSLAIARDHLPYPHPLRGALCELSLDEWLERYLACQAEAAAEKEEEGFYGDV